MLLSKRDLAGGTKDSEAGVMLDYLLGPVESQESMNWEEEAGELGQEM